jgi:NADH-quinone oxidoreductase subunit N
MPILIVFFGAIVGILVEAFVRPSMRRFVHTLMTPTILLLALFQVFANRDTVTTSAAIGSVIIDGPVIIAQATLLLLALLALLFILDVDSFTPEASALPGSEEERRALAVGKQQTEILSLRNDALPSGQ